MGLILAFFFLLQFSASAAVFTEDTTLAPLDGTYEGQDVVVSNCVLTVDGPHVFASLRLAATGTLNHSPATNGLVTMTAFIANELQVLTGTNPVPLLFSNVVATSVVVSDTNSPLTYTQNMDYVLGASNQFTTLQRTDTSSIPDGAGVLVSYSYIVGTTNAGLNLTITGDLEVEPGARILVDGLGWVGNFVGCGGSAGSPASGGGGTHGGFGGLGFGQARCGFAYDSLFQPVFPGGSGGSGSGGAGGVGAGRVLLNVGGTARINGVLSANGTDGTNSRAGGGSGGSIWLTAQTLTGTGIISADGGAGESVYGGGGGGGCIALYFATNQFAGSVFARGGTGFIGGGAGTIYQQATDLSLRQVTLDNGLRAGTNSSVQVTNGADVLVTGGALLSPSGAQTLGDLVLEAGTALTPLGPLQSVSITASNVTVQTGAEMFFDGAGYSAGAGTGKGGGYTSGGVTWGSGAGHGGIGGWGGGVMYWGGGGTGSLLTDVPGTAYGSATSPTTFGSGGGGYTGQGVLSPGTSLGGAGGGALVLKVVGTLLLDGSISANGLSGTQAGGGGGAGGSLQLSVGSLAGAGTLSANGGDGTLPHAGGGAGGRIALGFATNSFTGTISAYGGSGTNYGGAGTLYFKPSGQPGTLVLDNGGHAGTSSTPVSLAATDALAIQGAAQCQVTSPLTTSSLFIRSNCSLGFQSGSSVSVTVNGDFDMEPGACLSVNGQGGPAGIGSGSGSSYGSCGGGAGHGGYGANGADARAAGGLTYDSYLNPTNTGSGGGGSLNGVSVGGVGGGALRLVVSGALVLDGTISADASAATAPGGGGGSGGSLWITVAQFSGAGTVSANGGNGGAAGGGGGGGRVALEFIAPQTNAFTGHLSAFGGLGTNYGAAGTVLVSPCNQSPQMLVDNRGYVGTNTPVAGSSSFGLSVQAGARATCDRSQTYSTLSIGPNATFAFIPQYYNNAITVTGNCTIVAGGSILEDGLGYPHGMGNGPGNGCYSNSYVFYGGGGGYGGHGGAGAYPCASGGSVYGSLTQPTDLGSGGADQSSGACGGGRLALVVTGILSNDGTISANGTAGLWPRSGGGAGGSIWLNLGTLSGTGTISANGGSGDPAGGGGGGGGRIAITCSTNLFTGSILARGGSGWSNGNDGTIYPASIVPVHLQGTVRDTNGQPVVGVRLLPTGGQSSAITDVAGGYSLGVTNGWTGSLTPVLAGYMFVPGTRAFTNVLANLAGQDFLLVPTIVPTLCTSADGTNFWARWSGIPGVSYQAYWSSNLLDWLPWGAVIPGSNAVLEASLPITNAPQGFLRLKATN